MRENVEHSLVNQIIQPQRIHTHAQPREWKHLPADYIGPISKMIQNSQ